MVGVVKCLMAVVLTASMLSGGSAARNFRDVARHGAMNTTKVVTANATVAANASVAMVNSSLKNSSAALANTTMMAIPRPGTLRVCNAFSEDPLTATAGYPKPRVKSSAPAAYKECVSMKDNYKAGDTVELYFGNGRKTAVYLPYPPYADHAVILLVVFATPGVGSGATAGFDVKMQYFRNLKYPQVAAIDCAPGGSAPKLTLEHLEPKKPSESIAYDKVGPVDAGLTQILLDGKAASGGQFHADWAESYAVMITGDSSVAIWPQTRSFGSHARMGVVSLVVAIFAFAAF